MSDVVERLSRAWRRSRLLWPVALVVFGLGFAAVGWAALLIGLI
jgi:hypothetical protein